MKRKSMLRKGENTVDKGDTTVATHDLFHAVLAELLGVPYVCVRFGEIALSPDRKARAHLEPDMAKIDAQIAQSKGTPAERQLMFNLSLVALVGEVADRLVLKLPPEQVARRSAGDAEALEKLFAKTSLPPEDKANIIEQAKRWLETAPLSNGQLELAVKATLKELIDKKQMVPPQIRAVVEKYHVEDEFFPSGRPVMK